MDWGKEAPEGSMTYRDPGLVRFSAEARPHPAVARPHPPFAPLSLQEFKTHPRQAQWLLARARREGCGEAAQRAALCPYDLFVSKDWGASWANLTAASKGRVASFRDFEWGAKLEM